VERKKLFYYDRSDERLKTKTEKSTRLVYTGLHGELEHLKVKTRKDYVSCERVLLFIMNRESESERKDVRMRIGVMKDYKLKRRNLHVSHTLGYTRNWNT
jgi:hypothetical protein